MLNIYVYSSGAKLIKELNTIYFLFKKEKKVNKYT